MRLGIAVRSRNLSEPNSGSTHEQLVDIAQKVEGLGFFGLWVTDTLGRGMPSLDPLAVLSVACTVTKTIELGTAVIQLPLRHPVELAHRVQTVNLLSGGRLRLGVGAGSTRDDFEAVQVEFEKRFKLLPEYLDVMQRTWRGEGVFGSPISLWPGTEGGPPVFLGAWRSERSINLAANQCQGWMASGHHGGWADLEIGIRMFREAGGKRAIVTSILTDLRPENLRNRRTDDEGIDLYCGPAEARDRLKRIEDLGYDDAVLYCPIGDRGQLEAIRALI